MGLQERYEAIHELLITIKPQLNESKIPCPPALIQDLHQVASLAESFAQQRPKSNKSSQFAESLDQEGVSLWNISGLVRKSPGEDGFDLVVALRLAAFRLVEAGLETKPGIESLLHVVQLASKTGAALSELGSNDMAVSVLISAAKFEDMLKNVDDPDGIHRQAIASATMVYLSSRMEVAWKEGNYTVADFMSQKITDDDQRLTLLPPHARLLLAFKLHRIGNSILKGKAVHDGTKVVDAILWSQKAFSMVDRLEETAASGVAELKISILRTLVRAYFLSGSYDRAEAALEELSPSINASTDHESSDNEELRWLRLAILKRRKAGDSALLDAYKSLVDHMPLSEASITDVLQDLRTLGHQHALVTAVNQHFLEKILRCYGTELDYVHRMLLSLIFHCAKDENHARAMKTLDSAFTSVREAEFELSGVPTTACLTLIWQYGDRHSHTKKWKEAANWFLAGSHQLFRASNPGIGPKCFRKAALCYIEQREYARASTVIRQCPPDAATTHYIIFLTAVHQGLEDDAIKAIHGMVKAPDFDRKMLLLATQISHQSEMKAVLLSSLEALLKTLRTGNSGEAVVEALSLIRCIIRLVLNLLLEPGANKIVLINTVVDHFRTAKILTDAACAQKAISLIIKDVSWLWRTAYNCAVQGCSEWEQHGDCILELFELARDLLESFCQASPVDVGPELYICLINASFSAVAGRVFAARDIMVSTGTTDEVRLRAIAAEIRSCKARTTNIMNKNIFGEGDIHRTEYFVHTLRVFEAELLAQLKDWDGLSQVIEDVVTSGSMAACTYEAVADILWIEKDCPINVLYEALEAILRASLDHNTLSVEKFSRWLRAICTITLARNTPADRVKAIGYVEQAMTVMEGSNESEEPYPMDERQWLLGTSYNTGAECLHASRLDEAKRWFEASTVICKLVPGGKDCAEKISEAYNHLLARYTK